VTYRKADDVTQRGVNGECTSAGLVSKYPSTQLQLK